MRRHVAVVLLLPLITFQAVAHPHLFMRARYELVFDEAGLAGFWVEWEFDQYFTGSIMMDYDLDGDRKFDTRETQDVKENAFSNLANFDYFTFIGGAGGHEGVTHVEEFQPRYQAPSLVYRFYVPHRVPSSHGSTLVLAAYDPTYFCAIEYPREAAVTVAPGSRWSVEVGRRVNTDVEISYLAGDIRPASATVEELVIAYRRR